MNGLALCAGYGGIELGIEHVLDQYRTVCYVEGEAFAASHLVKKMEEGNLDQAPIWSNVKTFNGEPWRGKVDIITGGFPCQPYSSAGNRLGADDPRDLWPDFVRIIGEVRPGFIFLENVPNIVKLRLDQIVIDLDKLGYHATWGILAASEVGAPHRRKRWFMLAVLDTDRDGFSKHGPKKNSIGINERRQMERSQFETFSPFNANTNGFRWNKIKHDLRGREFDFEGFCLFDPDSNHSREFPDRRTIFEKNRNNVSRLGQTYHNGSFSKQFEIEPPMGRLVDGATNWVDKLRLLGNGVVPQQAAYAFQTLGLRLACGIVEKRTPKD